LFKLVDGYSPQSFGIHVAAIAGIKNEVLEIAKEKAKIMVSGGQKKEKENEIF
jgi:DNA mismatch repair ATPase MutS